MTKNSLISVTVKLFADLREYGPNKTILEFQEGTTIESIIEKYKIPKDERNLIIMVNGRPHRDKKFILKNRDVVALFPLIAGG